MNKSISRAFRIIDLIVKEGRPLSLADINEIIDAPKTTIFEILQTLTELGILDVTEDGTKSYSLGIKLLTIGTKCLDNISLRKIVHTHLEKASQQTSSIGFLAVENNGQMVYLDKSVHTGATLQPAFEIGMQVPMHCTGLGKALLSTYKRKKIDEIIKLHGLPKVTDKTITKKSHLKEELKKTRKRGFSIDNEENETGIYCIAAPIYNHLSEPIAAISIVTIKYTLTDEKFKKISKCVVNTALNISKEMGYPESKLYI